MESKPTTNSALRSGATDSLRSSFHSAGPIDAPETLQLLNRAQRGEDEALNALFSRYHEHLRRIVRFRLGAKLRCHLESVDILQSTYAVALRKLGEVRYRGKSCLVYWLAKIAEHKIRDARDYYFNGKHDKDMEVSLDALYAEGSDDSPLRSLRARDPGPSEQASARELDEVYDECVDQLPELYREVMILYKYHGEDYAFVAEQMGYQARSDLKDPIKAVKALHRRARIEHNKILVTRLAGLGRLEDTA